METGPREAPSSQMILAFIKLTKTIRAQTIYVNRSEAFEVGAA